MSRALIERRDRPIAFIAFEPEQRITIGPHGKKLFGKHQTSFIKSDGYTSFDEKRKIEFLIVDIRNEPFV